MNRTVAAGAAVVMAILLRNVFNSHLTAPDKTPLFFVPTSALIMALTLFYGIVSEYVMYLIIAVIGIVGIALSTAVSELGYSLGGSGLDRYNVGLALASAGALHFMVFAAVLPALSISSLLRLHTMLPLRMQTTGETATTIIFLLLAELFLVALPEELYFRGYLTDALSRFVQWPIAAAISVGVWAFLHALTRIPAGDYSAMVVITAGGLILTWLYGVSRNVATTTIAHASYNFGIDLFVLLLQLMGVPVAVAGFVALMAAEIGVGFALYRFGPPSISL